MKQVRMALAAKEHGFLTGAASGIPIPLLSNVSCWM